MDVTRKIVEDLRERGADNGSLAGLVQAVETSRRTWGMRGNNPMEGALKTKLHGHQGNETKRLAQQQDEPSRLSPRGSG